MNNNDNNNANDNSDKTDSMIVGWWYTSRRTHHWDEVRSDADEAARRESDRQYRHSPTDIIHPFIMSLSLYLFSALTLLARF